MANISLIKPGSNPFQQQIKKSPAINYSGYAVLALIGLLLLVLLNQQLTIVRLQHEMKILAAQKHETRISSIEKELIELGIRVGELPQADITAVN